MTTSHAAGMAEATRLTRAGRLEEATALLRDLLGGLPGGFGPDLRTPAGPLPRLPDVEPRGEPKVEPRGEPKVEPRAARPAGRPAERVAPAMPGRRRPARPEPASVRNLPAGASFATHAFAGEGGRRDYRLYVPAALPAGPAPLLVMLHGCTQSPEDFAAGTRMNALAEEHGLLVAYPGQPAAANAQRCWNWFNPADQRRGGGEPALVAGIARQVLRDRAADPRRVYVAGLSAGGAAAAVLAMAYPDLFAAVGVHSGLACGAARDVPSAFAAMRQGAAPAALAQPAGQRPVPTIVFHADRDATVHPRNADQVAAQSAAALPDGLRQRVERGQVPGGHAWTRTVHADGEGRALLEQWLVHGGGHAWSGGSAEGSYTDPRGPDASRAMLAFFLAHARDA